MRLFVVKSKVMIFVVLSFLVAFLLMLISPQTVLPTSGLKTTSAINSYQTQQHLVGLTIEVIGAHNNIDEILALLKEHSATATFFATGEVARQSPEMLLKIIDEGHEIAIMGFSYKDQSMLSAEEFRDGFHATKEQFDVSGVEYKEYYRPPYLKATTEMIAALSSFSYLTINGDVLFFEDDFRGIETRVDDATNDLKNGSIIRIPPIDGATEDILHELFDILETEAKSAVKLSSLLPDDGYSVGSDGVLSDGEF